MKKERKVIDAHLHIFGHCEFGDRLAHGIGDEPTQEYLTEKYYGRLGIEKGIVMGEWARWRSRERIWGVLLL